MDAAQNHTTGGEYSARSSHKPVNFYCAAPEAGLVEIVGDFNHWHGVAMQRLLDGWWFIRVQLCHGYHKYRFIVDGRPQLDPHATGIAQDEKDEPASLIAVS